MSELDAKARLMLMQQPTLKRKEIAQLLGCTEKRVANLAAWRDRGRNVDEVDFDPLEFFKWADDGVKLNKRLINDRRSLSWACPIDEPIILFPYGDAHAFSFWTDHALIVRDLAIVKNHPNVFMIGLGDNGQMMLGGFPKATPLVNQMLSPEVQEKVIYKLLDSMKHKIIAMSMGNHEQFSERSMGYDVFGDKVNRLVPVFEGKGLVSINLNGIIYRVLLQHKPYGRSALTRNAGNVRAYASDFPADTIISAHNHAYEIMMDSHYDLAKEVGCDFGGDRVMIALATYQNIKSNYANKIGGSGGSYASPCVVYSADKKQMVPFKYLEQAVIYLDAIKNIGR